MWRTLALNVTVTLTVSCATPRPPPPPPPQVAAEQAAVAGQHALDEGLANYIYAQLNANPVYYYRHVDVRVDNGVATLSGYVWDTDALYEARRIAGGVPGVTRVVSGQLELERNGRNSGVAR
jgi:hypothetical protein